MDVFLYKDSNDPVDIFGEAFADLLNKKTDKLLQDTSFYKSVKASEESQSKTATEFDQKSTNQSNDDRSDLESNLNDQDLKAFNSMIEVALMIPNLGSMTYLQLRSLRICTSLYLFPKNLTTWIPIFSSTFVKEKIRLLIAKIMWDFLKIFAN